jgi:hypothetical protein
MLRTRTIIALLLCTAILASASCAKDALKGAPQSVENIKITARFDALKDELFYFFVFNFTNAAAPSEATRPEPNVSGVDRGKNWEMYVVYHHNGGYTGPVWEFLKREPGDGGYWVDEIPKQLVQQYFYINAAASGNTLTLEIDPLELTDPENQVPNKFILDIMTANTGIDKQTNPEDLGIVYDWLDDIVTLNIEVGAKVEERDLLIEQFDDSTNLIAGSDLVDWRIEVK